MSKPAQSDNRSRTDGTRAAQRRRVLVGLTLLVAAASMLVLPAAAAETAGNGTVDWGGLGEMISGAAGLFPSITTLIMAVIPILILLIIVGFITGLFDSIIGAVKGAISFMR